MSKNEIVFRCASDAGGGFVARAIGHSIVTQAETIPELMDAIREAVRCHFDEDERPSSVWLRMLNGDSSVWLQMRDGDAPV